MYCTFRTEADYVTQVHDTVTSSFRHCEVVPRILTKLRLPGVDRFPLTTLRASAVVPRSGMSNVAALQQFTARKDLCRCRGRASNRWQERLCNPLERGEQARNVTLRSPLRFRSVAVGSDREGRTEAAWEEHVYSLAAEASEQVKRLQDLRGSLAGQRELGSRREASVNDKPVREGGTCCRRSRERRCSLASA